MQSAGKDDFLNYQLELDRIIGQIKKDGTVPRLFLHSCCAPCSSYVLEYLSAYFKITDFFYNPNITEETEYGKRCAELQRLITELPAAHEITFLEGHYDPEEFFRASKGLETCPEGGDRCRRCFELRLRETAQMAAKGGYDYFTTTLTISPLKNAALLNEIGAKLSEEYGVHWLPSDFKKRGGYARSIELSSEHGLYRQNYCGCVFSKRRDCVILKNKH